jgi:hypothetical protein
LTVRAKVGRAECLFDLAALPNADPQRRQDAIDEVNVLYNQANLPVDARVEVGFERGKLLEYDSNAGPNDAADAYWTVVKDIYYNDQARAELDHTPSGRFRMMQCLRSLQQIFVNQKNDTEAKKVGEIISSYGLGPTAVPASQTPAPTTTSAN